MDSTASTRLVAWLAWRGWTQPSLAKRCGVSQAKISKLVRGQQGPGIDLAFAIERATAEPRDDGTAWSDGPVRAAEWATHAPSVEQAETSEESAS